ncbi:MAG: hypothetical protein KDJ99_10105 [Candidatus Competibacteraceae bacterium]|nr:hypothetical protein [Candidatus Competibacteraceae bacterium]
MPANIKVPAHKAPWPPKNFAAAHYVGFPAEVNWWSLAKQVGRDNPWDIIIFNFETEDSREVNYYLETYVGCKTLVGNSYSFWKADPGIIYLPHPSWRPPVKFKMGSSRSSYSAKLAKQYASIIRNAAAVCPVVTLNGFTITPLDLYMVANHIESNKILCTVAPEIIIKDDEYARYHLGDPPTITSYREPNASKMMDVASITHESVHAALDARMYKNTTVGDHELLAHAVQSIVAARLFRPQIEAKLISTSEADYGLWFFGWWLTQGSNPRSLVDLSQLASRSIVDDTIDDPFAGSFHRLYKSFVDYVHTNYRSIWRYILVNDGL